ncbi:hypothetical protein GEMRC1_009927 [Eukaryota sp. GEM-RC1]
MNSTLLVLNLEGITFSSSQFKLILEGLENNLILKTVTLNALYLDSLILIFYGIKTYRLVPSFKVSPHAINAISGFIHYEKEIENQDLISLLKALKSSIPIKRVECPGFKITNLEELFNLVQFCNNVNNSATTFDIPPRFIDTVNGSFCFLPASFTDIGTDEVSSIQILLQYFRINELTLNRCRFTDDAITNLCDLIKVNNSLTSIDFSECNFLGDKVINAIQLNSYLKKINLSYNPIGFTSLLTIFELVSTKQLISNIQISPHFIDYSLGSITYKNRINNCDLNSLLKALKSNAPIKRVDCLGLRNPNLEELIMLLEILSINTSLVDLDIYPHSIDIDNGVFLFAHLSPKITVENMSSLSSALKGFSIKELAFKGCLFTNDALSVLCDLIRVNSSISIIDFSNCSLCDQGFLAVLGVFEFLPCLSRVNFSCNSITAFGASEFAEFLKINNSITEIDFSSNSIGNGGAAALSKIFKINTTITSICLRNNSVTERKRKLIRRLSKGRIFFSE